VSCGFLVEEKSGRGRKEVTAFIEVRWGAEEGGMQLGRPHGSRGDVGARPRPTGGVLTGSSLAVVLRGDARVGMVGTETRKSRVAD
jgi:hypothetical protein